jgi:ATP-dependent RNA helicase RhlE
MQNLTTQSVETPQQKGYTLFSEMPLSPYMKERVAAARFCVPTPVQGAAIPRILEGKDVLATAQTGTGKTLAFLIPVIEDLLKNDVSLPGNTGIAALVLVPTRELAMQVLDQFNVLRGKRLAPAALVTGGLSEHAQLQAIRKGARLVVATPGRLEDYLDRRLVQLNNLRTLVLDEADRMLDMGFLPAIRRIVSILPKQHQTVCFSATLEASVAHLVKDYLKSPVRLTFGSTLKPSENVKLQAFEVPADRKIEMLKKLLSKESGRVLVFSRTKRGTQRIASNLNDDGFAVAQIHGDRSQSQRNSALAGFQQGRHQILVATDVASRGIHVNDVAHVINYDLPEIAENFIHRVGRTGRADKKGVASTLISRDQRGELFQMERTLGLKIERVPSELGEQPVSYRKAGTRPHQEDRENEQRPRHGARHGHGHGNGRRGMQREHRVTRESHHAAAPSGPRIVLPGEFLQMRAES